MPKLDEFLHAKVIISSLKTLNVDNHSPTALRVNTLIYICIKRSYDFEIAHKTDV